MAGETTITVVGNVTAKPELRFTQAGAAVCSFTVASTPRKFNQNTGQWEDQDALFLRCSAWRQMAENIAESLDRGMRVIVQGRLQQRSYTTGDGDKRTVIELQVDEVGPSLRYATAGVNRATRDSGFQSPEQQQAASQQWNNTAAPAAQPYGQQPLGVNKDDSPPF